MNAAVRLRSLVVLWQIWISLALSIPLSYSVPQFLLLDKVLQPDSVRALFLAVVSAGVLASIRSWFLTEKHDAVLRALAVGAGNISPDDLQSLGKQPGQLTRAWIVPHVLTLGLLASPLRPSRMDFTTGVAVGLLGILMVSAASLPLNVALRTAFLRAVELAPAEVTRAMILAAENTADARGRITRRLVAALATPIFFVAVGCALITNAHLRGAEEQSREITARTLARCALEPSPAVVEGAGLDDAMARARELGFNSEFIDAVVPYSVTRGEQGELALATPLDQGSALVRFSGSTVAVVGTRPLLLACIAVFVAALLGFVLGNSFSADLTIATRRVRWLGTDMVMSGSRTFMRSARFAIVEELGRAIEGVAGRFRMFAQAQETAIVGREAAIRMRGLFFASVSHDLKSPLNAILGFTELVRREPLSDGQAESLHAIQTRGRELLALIETILDAARAEAGQLSLMYDELSFRELYAGVLDRVKQLSGDYPLQIWEEIDPELPPLLVDRIRISRALATFVAYSVRATQGGKMRLRAEMEDDSHIRIDVDVPSHLHSAKELELMLNQSQVIGQREHRGMALGLRLARSVVELHHGNVRVIDRGAKGAMFCITLAASRPRIAKR